VGIIGACPTRLDTTAIFVDSPENDLPASIAIATVFSAMAEILTWLERL
jgi:hypothetical protein